MVDYTSMAMLNGEVFTEENPAFVKVLNELGLSDVQINNIINAINKYSEEDNASLKDISNSLSKIEFDSLMSLFNINNRALNTISNDMKDIRDNIKDESIITNFPDDYPDKDVKTELELIKQGVKENKETNQLILDRLDGTIDTQVTGSNLEYKTFTNIAVERDAVFVLDDNIGGGGSRFSIYLTVIGGEGEGGVDVGVQLRRDNGSYAWERYIENKLTNINNVFTMDKITGLHKFMIRNNYDSDITILNFIITEFY